MTLDEARAYLVEALGPAVRGHLFTGKGGSWWGVVTLKGVHDAQGNTIDWAERLGFLTPVTVRELALEVSRQFATFGYELPKNSPLQSHVSHGMIAPVLTEGEQPRPATPGTP